MKHFIFTLIILANCTMLLAQSTESDTHKHRLIEFVNNGDFNKASEEIGHVENWSFTQKDLETYLDINNALAFSRYMDSLNLSAFGKDSLLMYIVREAKFYGNYSNSKGYIQDAINLYELICSLSYEVKGEDADLANSLTILGELHVNNSNYQRAEECFLTALEIRKVVLDPNHPDMSVMYNDLGVICANKGELDKAEQYYLQALEISEKLDDGLSPYYATNLNNIANFYNSKYDFPKAAQYYRKSLAVKKALYGENNKLYVASLYNLGTLYKKMGQFEDAEKCYLEVMSIAKGMLPVMNYDYASILSGVGLLYADLGDYPKCEKYILEGLDYLRSIQGEHHEIYGDLLKDLATIYRYMGNISKAKQLYEEALDVYKSIYGEQHVQLVPILQDIGLFYFNNGDYVNSEQCFVQGLSMLDKQHPLYPKILTYLGLLYEQMGDYKKEERCRLTEALEARKVIFGENNPEYAKGLINISRIYDRTKDYPKAEEYLLKAVQINGETDEGYSMALNNLAIVYAEQHEYEKAEQYYMLALNNRKKIYGEAHFKVAEALHALGTHYLFLKDYSKAEPCFDQAKNIYQTIFGEEHLGVAKELSFLGKLYTREGEYQKAESAHLKALEIRKAAYGRQFYYVSSLADVMDFYLDCKEYKKALPYIIEGSTISKEVFVKTSDYLSERQREEFWRATDVVLRIYVPYIAFRSYQEISSLGVYAYDNELFYKGTLLNATQHIQQSILTSGDTILLQQWQELKDKNERIAHLQEKEPRSPILSQLSEEAEALEKEITKSSVAYRENLRQWSITWDSVRAALKPNQVAIEFMSAPLNEDSTMYCALLLRHNSQHPELITLFNEKEVASLLPATTDNAEKINNTYLFNRNGWKLSELIWTNLKPYLNTKDVVFFAPTGILHRIAIENLPYDADRSMTEVYNLVRLSSTRELVLNKPAIPNRKASLYGGINYFPLDSAIMISNAEKYRGVGRYTESSSHVATDTVTRSIAYNLPGSKKEIEEVKPILDKMQVSVTVYSQDTACEESFKALSGTRQNILLLSTHGFFWQDVAAQKERFFSQRMTTMSGDHYTVKIDPLDRCGLLFSGANTALSGHQERLPQGVDDGILTAKEISTMDFRDADIVVLSACETGLGDISGEGVFGLQRAFKMAGAQTILMTLWQVHDDATRLFMTSFFTNLGKGLTKREAFHNAQREVRNYTVTKEQTVQSTSAKEKMHNKTAINTVTAMETVTTQPYQSPYYWAGFILLD